MSYAANRSQEYLRNAVLTAAPEQLQLMLYDGAIRFAARGLEAIRSSDREAAFVALERAQLIVLEMSNGIRREVNPALADRMSALYSYIYRRLIDANVGQDEQAVEDALRILRYERETWLLLVEKLHKEAPRPAGVAEPESARSAEDAPVTINAQA
jgi:flagellar protein FliS